MKVAIVVFGLLLLTVGTVYAVTPIYNSSNTSVSNSSWMAGRTDPTIDNVSTFITRVGTFVIGDSSSDSGAGPLIVGLLVGMSIIGYMGTSRSGIVAGGTVGVIAAATLTKVSLAPGWIFGVVIMLTGLVLAIAYLRLR